MILMLYRITLFIHCALIMRMVCGLVHILVVLIIIHINGLILKNIIQEKISDTLAVAYEKFVKAMMALCG